MTFNVKVAVAFFWMGLGAAVLARCGSSTATSEKMGMSDHLGEAKMGAGDPVGALPFLEQALKIRTEREPQPGLVAEAQFSLARALWDSGRDRTRAGTLAMSAARAYAGGGQARDQQRVAVWLESHKPGPQ